MSECTLLKDNWVMNCLLYINCCLVLRQETVLKHITPMGGYLPGLCTVRRYTLDAVHTHSTHSPKRRPTLTTNESQAPARQQAGPPYKEGKGILQQEVKRQVKPRFEGPQEELFATMGPPHTHAHGGAHLKCPTNPQNHSNRTL